MLEFRKIEPTIAATRSVRTVVATGRTANLGKAVRLEHRSAGVEPAGSGTRTTAECFAVLVIGTDGTPGGQRFKSEVEARERFAEITGVER